MEAILTGRPLLEGSTTRGTVTTTVALILALAALAGFASATFAPTAPLLGEAATVVETSAALAPEDLQSISDGLDSGAPANNPAPTAPVIPGAADLDDGVLLGLGGIAAGAAVFALLLGARYTRPEDVLANDVRSAIYGYLRRNVGANLKQITDDLTLSTTNAVWHLRKLESTGLVHSRKFNGYKVYYLAEGGIEARNQTLSAAILSNENARAIFQFVTAHQGTHQREIARALGVNHGTVRWHLKKLCATGLLKELRTGRVSVYHATEQGLSAATRPAQQRPAALASAAN